MKTLFLHIGTPKTGTSALQVFFAQNHKQLQAHNILYPGKKTNTFQEGLQGKISSGNGVFVAKYFREPNVKKYQKSFSSFLRNLKKNKKHHILYSSEAFWNLKRPHFIQIAEVIKSCNYSAKIIVYLRDEKEMLLASYTQAVKAKSYTNDIFSFYQKRNKRLSYLKKLNILSEIFGKDQLVVRYYKRDHLVMNFLQILGIDKIDSFVVREEKINPSPTVHEIEFLRSVNKMEIDRSFSDRLLNLKKQDKEQVSQMSLPEDLKQKVGDLYKDNHQKIKEQYIDSATVGSDSLITDNTSVIHEVKELSPYDEIAAKMLYSLHREMEIYEKKIKQLEKKYNSLFYIFLTTIIVLIAIIILGYFK